MSLLSASFSVSFARLSRSVIRVLLEAAAVARADKRRDSLKLSPACTY